MKIINKFKTTKLDKLKENNPKFIIIHSTTKYPSFKHLLKFHRKRGWQGVGYHFFISKSGKIYQARPLKKEGAHSRGFNFESIGIGVYRNGDKPSDKNLIQLKHLIGLIKKKYPFVKIVSHSEMQLKYINKRLNKRIKFNPSNLELIKKKINNLKIENLELKNHIKNFNDCPGKWFYYLF